MRLGELLIEAGAITAPQLELALRQQVNHGGRLGINLIELGFLTEATLTKILAAQLHLPRVGEAALDKLPRSVLDLLSVELAAQHSVCPVRLDGPRLHLAMSDPLDKAAIAAVAAHTSCQIRPLVAAHGVVRHALQKHYGISPPKARTINLRSEAAMPVLRHGENPHADPPDAPFFDPHAARAGELQLVELGDRAAHAETAAPAPVAAPPTANASPGPRFAEQIAAVQTIDDVGDIVTSFVHHHFARSVLLLMRGENLVGWRVDGAGTSAAAIRTFSVPMSALPALAHALSVGAPVITRDASLVLPFVALLGDPAGALNLVLPLWHRGRSAACLSASGGGDDVELRAPEYAAFAAKIALAFQLVVLRKQILD